MTASTRTVWITECSDPASWIRRLTEKSERSGDCIVWTGRVDRSGYGVFKDGRRQTGAHRAAWLAHRGPIPTPLVIDHLCRNRRCINPDHMEPVTNAENASRGNAGLQAGQHDGLSGRLKMHCLRGHVFDDRNTRWATAPDGYTRRVCRVCQRERLARLRASRK